MNAGAGKPLPSGRGAVTDEETPPGWEVPTLSFLKEEPLFFRVPRKQAGFTVVVGGGVFLPVLKFVGIFAAIPAAAAVCGLTLVVLRWLYAKDPYWYPHLTSHRWPPARWTGA